MGNNPRVMIGLGVAAVLGILLAVATEMKPIGGFLVLLAIVGFVFVLRSGAASDDDFFEPPEERSRPAARRETSTAVDDAPPLASRRESRPAADSGGGLPTWDGAGSDTAEPLEPLTAWTPLAEPEDEEEIEDEEVAFEEDDSFAELEELDFGDDELATLDAEYEELVEEETAEPEAEAAPAKAGGFSFGNNSKIQEIEDVHSDQDIMASSAATELAISADKGENSELARLLAKVQSRLAAYE